MLIAAEGRANEVCLYFGGRLLRGNRAIKYSADGMIAFASSFPGAIRAIEISPERSVIVQKSGFLASETGVELSVFFQKKLTAGFFGGEGFIMQKLTGRGMAFIEIDGSTVEYDLAPGQQIVVDTGYLAMMDATCTMTVQAVKGVKNVLLGGESLFNTIVTGPGHVVLQTMPMNNFVGAVSKLLPKS